MSAAEMSSEGGTRSHPRAGLYVFVPRSQFSKGEGRCDGDHGVQRNERERVLEPPCIDAGCRPPFPIRIERGLERPREIRVVHDEANLAILRRRSERPVHARDEDRAAVHHRALVVETFDRAARLQQSDLEGQTLVHRATVDPLEDVVVRARVGFDRGPAPIEEDPHGDAATCGRQGRFEEGTRGVSPHLIEVERVDRESVLRGGEQAEDSSGSSVVSGARTIRADRGAEGGPEDHGTTDGAWGNGRSPGSRAAMESGRLGSKSVSKTFRRIPVRSASSTITDQPRLPSWSGENPAVPKFSEPIQAARRSTRAYFAWR